MGVLRKPTFFIAAMAGLVALILATNVQGWRARIVARIFRVDNPPNVVTPPATFHPSAPPGFTVSLFATGLKGPRWLATAPNGDLFVAESGAGEVLTFRAHTSGGHGQLFADGLNLPFGIAFLHDFVYVADTDGVVRFPFDRATSKRTGNMERILSLPGLGYNQHWTRSIAFSADEKYLFASVGSKTNISIEADVRRAAILVGDVDGSHARVYASGLRNAVGLAVNPWSSALWASVNERDDIADDSPDDYFTHIVDGGFYGWPYSYNAHGGTRIDNRVSSRPDMVARALSPDVMLGAHVAPLQFLFRDTPTFPPRFSHGAFIAEHGSWNRRERSGYQVVFLPFRGGVPDGGPIPFLTGFVPDRSGPIAYGRPVGIAAQDDGSLLVSDDGADVIWKVAYEP